MTNENVKLLRERAGLSQAELAERVGTTQPQIARLESGGRKLSLDWAKRLAPALRVSPVELLPKDVIPTHMPLRPSSAYRPPPDLMNVVDAMPVYASAEGGQGHLIVSTDEIERVPRPYTLEGITEAYGILITGESMDPAYKPGDIAWVNPRLPPQRDTECILYRIDDGTGEAKATIKNLIGWTATEWHLEQYNPRKKFSLPRSEWVTHHRVVGNFRRR